MTPYDHNTNKEVKADNIQNSFGLKHPFKLKEKFLLGHMVCQTFSSLGGIEISHCACYHVFATVNFKITTNLGTIKSLAPC